MLRSNHFLLLTLAAFNVTAMQQQGKDVTPDESTIQQKRQDIEKCRQEWLVKLKDAENELRAYWENYNKQPLYKGRTPGYALGEEGLLLRHIVKSSDVRRRDIESKINYIKEKIIVVGRAETDLFIKSKL